VWAALSRQEKAIREETMSPEELREIAERDQFWSSLRALLPAIEALAAGELKAAPQQEQLAQLLARVVLIELQFRDRQGQTD
jgi:hypothetical protein